MPARRESRSNNAGRDGSPTAPSETAPTAPSEPAPTEAAPSEPEAVDAGAADGAPEEDVPMNRAERRAKAKGKHAGQAQPPTGKILPGRTNQAHGHRSYANRRSGG